MSAAKRRKHKHAPRRRRHDGPRRRSIWLPAELVATIQRLAAAEERTEGAMTRVLIRRGLRAGSSTQPESVTGTVLPPPVWPVAEAPAPRAHGKRPLA